jgi:ParB-like chromosome segregation protein Spo0J
MKILRFENVDIEKISISEANSRANTQMSELSLSTLMASINIHGVINPITITEDFKVVVGGRRFRATKFLWERTKDPRFKTIPCYITRFESKAGRDPKAEMMAASGVENLTKMPLKAKELADAVTILRDLGCSEYEIAKTVGLPVKAIKLLLSKEYLKLPQFKED